MFASRIWIDREHQVPPMSYFVGLEAQGFVMPPRTCPLMPGARVLFVDGENTIRRRPDGMKPEGHLALDDALQREELKDVLVVASGEWKDILSIERMRNLFSDAVAERIVDKAPQLGEDMYPYKDAHGTPLFRFHLEIQAWLALHPEIADYCVVEPFWPLPPHVERAVFIQDGLVFGERPEHLKYLIELIGDAGQGGG